MSCGSTPTASPLHGRWSSSDSSFGLTKAAAGRQPAAADFDDARRDVEPRAGPTGPRTGHRTKASRGLRTAPPRAPATGLRQAPPTGHRTAPVTAHSKAPAIGHRRAAVRKPEMAHLTTHQETLARRLRRAARKALLEAAPGTVARVGVQRVSPSPKPLPILHFRHNPPSAACDLHWIQPNRPQRMHQSSGAAFAQFPGRPQADVAVFRALAAGRLPRRPKRRLPMTMRGRGIAGGGAARLTGNS
jgi:hypothetical protein